MTESMPKLEPALMDLARRIGQEERRIVREWAASGKYPNDNVPVSLFVHKTQFEKMVLQTSGACSECEAKIRQAQLRSPAEELEMLNECQNVLIQIVECREYIDRMVAEARKSAHILMELKRRLPDIKIDNGESDAFEKAIALAEELKGSTIQFLSVLSEFDTKVKTLIKSPEQDFIDSALSLTMKQFRTLMPSLSFNTIRFEIPQSVA